MVMSDFDDDEGTEANNHVGRTRSASGSTAIDLGSPPPSIYTGRGSPSSPNQSDDGSDADGINRQKSGSIGSSGSRSSRKKFGKLKKGKSRLKYIVNAVSLLVRTGKKIQDEEVSDSDEEDDYVDELPKKGYRRQRLTNMDNLAMKRNFDIVDETKLEDLYDKFDFYELPESVYGYAIAIMLIQLKSERMDRLTNSDMSFLNFDRVRESYMHAPNYSFVKFSLSLLLTASNFVRYFFVIGPAVTTFAVEGYILYNLYDYIPPFTDYENNGLCATGQLLQCCVLSVFYCHLMDSLKEIYKEFVTVSTTEILMVKTELICVKYELANAPHMRFLIFLLVFLEFSVWLAVLVNGTALVLSSVDFLMMIQNSVAISFINEIGTL